jgi:hypothetical protein
VLLIDWMLACASTLIGIAIIATKARARERHLLII